MVAELFEGVCEQVLGIGVGRVRIHEVVEHLSHPAVVTVRVVPLGLLHDRVRSAHVLDIPGTHRHAGQRMQSGSVAVEPPEVFHERRLDIVVDRPVVATKREVLSKTARKLDHLCGFDHVVAHVGRTNRLVVDVFVGSGVLLEMLVDPVRPPDRPVMRGVQHLGHTSPLHADIAQVLRPVVRAADCGAPQRVDVVDGETGIFGNGERLVLGDVEEHLRGSLGIGGQDELEFETVDHFLLTSLRDQVCRQRERRIALRRVETQPAGQVPRRPTLNQHAVLVARKARFTVTADHGFVESGGGESLRRKHLDLAGVDVGFGDDPQHAAVMVDMAVREDDGHNRLLGTVLEVEAKGSLRHFLAHERIHDDDAGVALDERDVRDVHPAYLIDAIGHLEQAGVPLHDLGLTPQARIDRGRRRSVAGKEIEIREIPDDCSLGVLDHTIVGEWGDETLRRKIETLLVGEIQLTQNALLGLLRRARRRIVGVLCIRLLLELRLDTIA